ncbi:hypothetical protein [Mesomycoplasma hyorhinis]|uniref:hypothetical protein n=1 Tax=Mesomycoplasma hyorhinis TaxID=2100 RepID=UPI003DA3A4AB
MILKNALITTKDKQFLGYIKLNLDGKIEQIGQGTTQEEGIDCKQNVLLTAFIDSHTYGGYGLSFNKIAETDFIKKFLKYKHNLDKKRRYCCCLCNNSNWFLKQN